MAIPAPQLAIINAGQSSFANIKTELASLLSGGDAMMAIAYGIPNQQTASPQLVLYTQKHRAAIRAILAQVESAHAQLGADLMQFYGATDGVAVVMGGGAR